MLETLIGVGGNLLGGLFGSRSAKKAAAQQRAWALEDQKMQFVRHREASELGGFNPLATLGMGQGVAPTPIDTTNYMGSAIADSALLVADSIAARKADKTAKAAQDLAAANAKLNQQVRDLTLRPKIGGVYAQRANTPTLRQALGAEDGSDSGNVSVDGVSRAGVGRRDDAGASPLRPLSELDVLDPRREVEQKPVPSGPGFMVVDNPYLPKMWFPSIDGDEPVDLLDAPSIAPFALQMMNHYAPHLADGGTLKPSDRKKQREHAESGQAYLTQRQQRYHAWLRKAQPMRFDPNHRDGYYRP